MKNSCFRGSAFTLVEWLVTMAVVGIFLVVAEPMIDLALTKREMAGTLENARQIQLATKAMAFDTFNAGGDGIEWSVRFVNGQIIPITASTFFDALVKGRYLSKEDLRVLLTAPGRGPGDSAPTAANSCFKIFAVEPGADSRQPFLVTANWDQGRLAPDEPYGPRGFVILTKGGSGSIHTRAEDASLAKVFPPLGDPNPNSLSDPTPYSSAILK